MAKTEKEIIDTHRQNIYLINKELKAKRYSLEEIGDVLPGLFHVNQVEDFRILYMNETGCDLMYTSVEELKALNDRFPTTWVEPKSLENAMVHLSDLVSKKDPGQVCTFFQNVKMGHPEEQQYQWFLTNTKFYTEKETISLSLPLKNMGPLSQKMYRVIEENQFMRRHFQKFMSLTKREKEVLSLLAQGFSNQEVSEQLTISKYTVADHRKAINRKLAIKHFKDVLKYARAFDLI